VTERRGFQRSPREGHHGCQVVRVLKPWSNIRSNSIMLWVWKHTLQVTSAFGLSILIGRILYHLYLRRRAKASNRSLNEKQNVSSTEETSNVALDCLTSDTPITLSDEYHRLKLRHLALPSAISPTYLEDLFPRIKVMPCSTPSCYFQLLHDHRLDCVTIMSHIP
jgi:hypothetical protein